MKKIFSFILFTIFSIFLISCDVDSLKEHSVKFFYDDNLLHEEKVNDGELVDEYIHEEVSYWTLDNKEFNFNTKIYEDLKLIGVKEDTFKVKFIIDEDDIYETFIIDNIEKGSKISEIEEYEIENKKFLGWYLDNQLFDFNTTIINNLTLHAKYVNLENEVKLIHNDEVLKTYNVLYGETLSIDETLSLNNLDFMGWYYNDKYLFTEDIKVYEDMELVAKFRDKNYNLNNTNFDIFYLNDTHGAVLKKKDELGISYIANYIENKKDDNSLFITGGDTFQGQLISNENKGEILVEIFNNLDLDAFVIGNHEFDWGIEEILKYKDPTYKNMDANFPLLGANIVYKNNNERPDFIDGSTIVEKDGKNIGIIGVIGDGLESSIANQRIKDYAFTNAYEAVLNEANKIKDKVDFIIVATHGNDSNFNENVARINKVNAVFNGHTHQAYKGLIDNKIPYMQSGRYSEYVGHLNLKLDSNFEIISSDANNIKNHELLNDYHVQTEEIINSYYENIKHLYEEELIKSSNYMSQNDLANYIARVMKEVTGAVAGFQNSGGTRSTFNQNQMITAADIFQVFPFDNEIIYTKIKGSSLKKMLNDSYFIISSDIDNSSIVDYKDYIIATNDYIYYHPLNQYAFKNTDPILYGDMYETLYEVILKLKENGYETFNINSPILIN